MTSLQANPVFLQSDNYVLERENKEKGRREKEYRARKGKRRIKKLKVYNVIIQKCFNQSEFFSRKTLRSRNPIK
jgi:hypothetical protein